MTYCAKEESGKLSYKVSDTISYKVSDSKNQEDVGW